MAGRPQTRLVGTSWPPVRKIMRLVGPITAHAKQKGDGIVHALAESAIQADPHFFISEGVT